MTDTPALKPDEPRVPFPLPTRGSATRPDADPADPHPDMAVDIRRGRAATGQSVVPSFAQFAALAARVAALEDATPLARLDGETDTEYVQRALDSRRAPAPGTYTVGSLTVGDRG